MSERLTPEQRELVLAEIERWRNQGLIDLATRERLRADYLAWRPTSREAAQPDEAVVDDQAVLEEVEGLAEELLAQQPAQAAMPLDGQLEIEAQAHLAFEAEVVDEAAHQRQQMDSATAAPVAERSSSVVGAICDAAVDAVPLAVEEPTAEQRLIDRETAVDRQAGSEPSRWLRTVRPFLYSENSLWLAGGLLVVFGSLHFLRLIWNDLSDTLMHVVTAAALHAYAGAFFGVGYALSVRRQAHAVGRILFGFAAALLPLATVASGELAGVLVRESGGASGAALAVGCGALTLAIQGVIIALIAGLQQRLGGAVRLALSTWLGLAALTLAVAPLHAMGAGRWLLALVPVGLLLLGRGLLALEHLRPRLRATILAFGGGALWAFVGLVGRIQVAEPVEPTRFAALLAPLAALLLVLDRRLRRREGGEPRLTALALGLYGVLLAAVAVAVFGLARTGYFDLSSRLVVLTVAAVGAAFFARAAHDHGRSAATYLAASAGLLAYFFLPAPFAGVLIALQQWLKGALGYVDQPLPLAYYGLAFLPYLVGLALLAVRLRGPRPDISRDLQRFVAAVALALVPLALQAAPDLRPALWTWPLYAVAAFVAALVFARPRLVYAGHALALGALWVTGEWLTGATPALLLAATGALAALASHWRARVPAHVGHAALCSVGLALVSMAPSPPTLGQAVLVLALAAAGLAVFVLRFGGPRLVAHAAGLVGFAGALAALGWLDLSRQGVLCALLGIGGLATVALVALRRAPQASPGWRLVAQPALVVGLLGSAAGLAHALLISSPPGQLVAGMLFGAIGLGYGRSRVALVFAWLGVVVAGVGVVAEVAPGYAPLALAPLAAAALLAGRWLLDHDKLHQRRKGRALEVCAHVTLGAFVLAVFPRLDAAADATVIGWAGLGGAGVALFALAAVRAYVQRHGRLGAAFLAVFAVSLALAAAMALERVLWHLGVGGEAYAWHHGLLLCGISLAWSLAARSPLTERPPLRPVAWWCALAALALPAGLLALPVVAGVAGHESPARLADFLGLGPGLLAAACAACVALGATAVARWGTQSAAGAARHVMRVSTCLLVATASLSLWPGAHLALALVGAATLLVIVDHRGSVLWPLSVAAAALLASHGHLRRPELWLTLAVSGALLWRLARRSAGVGRALLDGGWAAAGSAAVVTLVAWIAAVFSTGRYPAAAVLTLIAPALLLTGLVLQRAAGAPQLDGRSATWVRWVGHVDLPLAGLAALLGAALAPSFVLALALASLAGAAAAMWALGRRQDLEWLLHGALLGASALYVASRLLVSAHVVLGPWVDVLAVIASAQLALLVARDRQPDGARRALLSFTLVSPLVAAPVVAAELSAASASLFFLLVGVHYGVASRAFANRPLRALSLVFGNATLFAAWSALGWNDLQLYLIPVGLTLLVLIQLYRAELGQRSRRSLRNLVLFAVYTICTAKALGGVTPLQALVVVPALCVAGMVAGVALRIRSYVLFGGMFLAADLLLNMLRYGIERRPLGALFLTMLGLALVAAMVVFSLERERILRRYSAIVGQLRGWD